MAECVDLLEGMISPCEGLAEVGGVKKTFYIGQLSQLGTTPYTQDANDYIDTIAFAAGSPDYGLYKFSGKKSKNNGTWEITAGDNVNTFNTSANLVLYPFTPEQITICDALVGADDLFVIFPNEAGTRIWVYGITQGLNATAGSGGTGVGLQDDTSYKLTLSGEQLTSPMQFLNGGTFADSIAYLDGISV